MSRSWYAWYKLDIRVLRGRQSNSYGFLRDDLYLSDESDDEQEIDPVGLSPNITAGRSVSPDGAPPAIHDSSSAVNLTEESLPQVKNLFYAPEPIIQPPPPNLSSESDLESDTINDEVEEYVTSFIVPKMISPLGATPPSHNSRWAVNLNLTFPQVRKHVYAPMPIIKPLLTSSSESDSESNSNNVDSAKKTLTSIGSSRFHSKPADHLSTYTKPFCDRNDQSTSAPPNSTSPDSGNPPTEKSGSLISSFSEPDSDQENQQPPATTKSAPQHMPPNTTKSTTRDSKIEVIPPGTVGKVIHLVPDKVLDKLAKRGVERLRKDSIEHDKKKVLKKRGRKPNGATRFSDSSDDDSDGPFPGRRKRKSSSGTKIPLNKDSLKNQEVTSKKNSGDKNTKWEERKQQRHCRKGSDSVDDKKSAQKKELKSRSEAETKKSDSGTASKKKDGASSSIRRKSGPRSSAKQPKSAEYVPSSYDSSSDTDTGNTVAALPKPKVNASRNSSEEMWNRSFGPDISLKTTPKMIGTDRKVNENEVAAGKNKNDTIRKLFTPERDSEGGKGKGGGKGGNGKAGVNAEGDHSRNNSSIEDEDLAITNTNRTKPTLAKKDPNPRNLTLFSPSTLKKDEPSLNPVASLKTMIPDERKRMPLWVEIDLDDLKTIPTLRERFEQKMPWLSQSNITEFVIGIEEKQTIAAPNEDSASEINETENKTKKDTKSEDASAEHSEREHESLKRKREHGSSSVSSHSTISNMPVQNKMTEHSYPHNSQHSENKDEDNYRKFKRQKEESNHPHDSIHIEDHRDITEVPCSQSQSQTENINLAGAPPINNERVPTIEEQQQVMRDAIRDPEYIMGTIAVIPVPPIERTNVPPTFVRREYHSHFEPPEELMDHEIRGPNHYLMEAMRLKARAEREPDPIKQCMLYLEAVQYLLLTNHAMESAFLTERAAFNMYRDTITQIQHIATTFRKPQNTSPVFHKLSVLSYRCQAVLFYKLFAKSMHDARKIQRRMSEYCDKHLQNPVIVDSPAPFVEHHVHSQGQGTLPNLSPSPSPQFVVKSQSFGYNSGGAQLAPGGPGVVAESRDAAVWVPLPICNAMAKMHHHLGYLISFQELWDMANHLVIKGNYTDFFIELDRCCKPLSMHSSIIDVVRYVREGIRRLRYEI